MPSYATVKCWAAEFRPAEEAMKISPGPDVRLKLPVNVQLIADTVGISTGSVTCKHLLMIKVCAQWVPRMLDRKMKNCRCEASSKKTEAHAVEIEFVFVVQCNRR